MRGWTAELAVDAELDARFMAEALALGRANLGQTWPNPSVGAIVVKGGVVVGRGATAPGGRPHAEPIALEQAGLQAVGATLYVTLEPCSHRSVRGGTPCLEHTLLSGVSRVVSAFEDPNPHISGLGHALLRSAGVKVSVGVGGAEAARDHRGHVLRVRERRPMVTLKIAHTADGYCAPAGGGRLQISGEEAMRAVHLLRASHDAIMVGSRRSCRTTRSSTFVCLASRIVLRCVSCSTVGCGRRPARSWRGPPERCRCGSSPPRMRRRRRSGPCASKGWR